MTVNVEDVAQFIISNTERTTNLKLQKLLYYVQGWHLGVHNTIIFPDSIEAWIHGPVVPKIFQQYRTNRWQPIPKPLTTTRLVPALEEHVKKVLSAYGRFSGEQLERLTHAEDPWLSARGTLRNDEPSRAVITVPSMRHFFGAKAQRETAQSQGLLRCRCCSGRRRDGQLLVSVLNR